MVAMNLNNPFPPDILDKVFSHVLLKVVTIALLFKQISYNNSLTHVMKSILEKKVKIIYRTIGLLIRVAVLIFSTIH